MPGLDLFNIHGLAALIEFGGALLISGYVLVAVFFLVWRRDITRARLLVADGAIMGLSFKLAGTLLKTIELHSWNQILLFSSVLALRTLLKWLFNRERVYLEQRGANPVGTGKATPEG